VSAWKVRGVGGGVGGKGGEGGVDPGRGVGPVSCSSRPHHHHRTKTVRAQSTFVPPPPTRRPGRLWFWCHGEQEHTTRSQRRPADNKHLPRPRTQSLTSGQRKNAPPQPQARSEVSRERAKHGTRLTHALPLLPFFSGGDALGCSSFRKQSGGPRQATDPTQTLWVRPRTI